MSDNRLRQRPSGPSSDPLPYPPTRRRRNQMAKTSEVKIKVTADLTELNETVDLATLKLTVVELLRRMGKVEAHIERQGRRR